MCISNGSLQFKSFRVMTRPAINLALFNARQKSTEQNAVENTLEI